MDEFLSSARGKAESSEGEFTLAAERARELLAHKALPDVWQAWLCLLQGFHRLGMTRLRLEIGRSRVILKPDLGEERSLNELAADERFLLGWLNLDWFGKPTWRFDDQELAVELKGSVWKRYNHSRVLLDTLGKALLFYPCPVFLAGRDAPMTGFSSKRNYTLMPARDVDRNALVLPFSLSSLPAEQWRLTSPPGDELPGMFSAVAYGSRRSWSQVTWVSHGVVIKEERNTLERPNLSVVASVQSLGLKTDLSGFEIVHDDAYLDFTRELKSKALWML